VFVDVVAVLVVAVPIVDVVDVAVVFNGFVAVAVGVGPVVAFVGDFF